MTTTNLERREPSRRSVRGLDWLAFFLADIQTGWGPFVAGYLTAGAWAQFHIGLVLTIGTITGLVLQIPAGALIDMGPAKRFLGIGIASISASALLLALWPALVPVIAAKVLHAIASALVGPSFVAVSLGLVGHAALSERLGRNARFLSLGNAIAAGVMGAIGYYLTYQAIFFFTALLGIPTLLALTQIDLSEVDPSLYPGRNIKGRERHLAGGGFNLGGEPCLAGFRRSHRAVSACQCGDAADRGRAFDERCPTNGDRSAGDLDPGPAIRGRLS